MIPTVTIGTNFNFSIDTGRLGCCTITSTPGITLLCLSEDQTEWRIIPYLPGNHTIVISPTPADERKPETFRFFSAFQEHDGRTVTILYMGGRAVGYNTGGANHTINGNVHNPLYDSTSPPIKITEVQFGKKFLIYYSQLEDEYFYREQGENKTFFSSGGKKQPAEFRVEDKQFLALIK